MGRPTDHPSGYRQSDNTHRSVGGNSRPTNTLMLPQVAAEITSIPLALTSQLIESRL